MYSQSSTSASANVAHAAVRKNRYVILPADFEEAWKVGVWLCRGFVLLALVFSLLTKIFLTCSKRSREEMRLMSSVRLPLSGVICFVTQWHSTRLFTRSVNCMLVKYVFSQLLFLHVA
jgi:hypothetical protein